MLRCDPYEIGPAGDFLAQDKYNAANGRFSPASERAYLTTTIFLVNTLRSARRLYQ